MARRTHANNLGVIYRKGRFPRRGDMTRLANVTRGDMANGLLVAIRAKPDDFVMIDGRHRCPYRTTMTRAAVVGGVGVRRILARIGITVMTRNTRTRHLRVVDGYRRRPCCSRVTQFASIGTRNVTRIFSLRLHAVVTRYAITQNKRVVITGWQPCCG